MSIPSTEEVRNHRTIMKQIPSTQVVIIVIVVISLTGCMGNVSTNESSPKPKEIKKSTQMKLTGILLTDPVSMMPTPPRDPGGPEERNLHAVPYSAVLSVTEDTSGPQSFEGSIIIIHFDQPTDKDGPPQAGKKVRVNGTYQPENQILDGTSEEPPRDGITVVGTEESNSSVPVVGEKGDRVQINRYVYSSSSTEVEIIKTENVTLQIINDDTAVIKEGRVKLGDIIEPRFERLIVEIVGPVTDSDNSEQSYSSVRGSTV